MGHHRIVIDRVGAHGCDRKAQPGEKLTPCHHPNCFDCKVASFVADLNAQGGEIRATLTHWPGEASEVVDDLVTRTRAQGAFTI